MNPGNKILSLYICTTCFNPELVPLGVLFYYGMKEEIGSLVVNNNKKYSRKKANGKEKRRKEKKREAKKKKKG
jgi:hypothetical protein